MTDDLRVLVIPADDGSPVYIVSGPRGLTGLEIMGGDEIANERATLLATLVERRLTPTLLGDVVVSGPRDERGHATSVDPAMIDLARELGWLPALS